MKKLVTVWPIAQEGDLRVMAFHAETPDGKRFFLGQGIGRIDDGDQLKALVLNRLAKADGHSGTLYFVEFATEKDEFQPGPPEGNHQ